MTIAILIVSVIIFCLGSVCDAATMIVNPAYHGRSGPVLYKNESGKLPLLRYTLVTTFIVATQLVVGLNYSGSLGSVIAVVGAAWRFRRARQSDEISGSIL